MEQQNYYIIIPAPVFNDKDLSDKEKLLMGLINSLLNEDGYCFASNTYLAEKMKTTAETISRRLNKLKAKEYIEIVYLKKGNIVTNRKIYPIPPLTKTSTTDDENINGTVDENVKESNKVFSNKTIVKEKIYKKEKSIFKKPTLEEIEQYCKERNNNVNAKRFFDYYEANDWKDQNGKKVTSWKQKMIANWETKQDKLLRNEKRPEWLDKNLEISEATKEEQEKIAEILKNYK